MFCEWNRKLVSFVKMTRNCCINKCNKLNKGLPSSLFKFPKNSYIRKMWIDAISSHMRRVQRSTLNLYVCERHFDSAEVERDYKTVLPDGTVNKIPRQPPILKKNAVPHIFYTDEETEGISLELSTPIETQETVLSHGIVHQAPRRSTTLKKSDVPLIFYADEETVDISLELPTQLQTQETSSRPLDNRDNNAENQGSQNAKALTELDQVMGKYDTLDEQDFMAQVQKLPNRMKEQVTACFMAATKGKNGIQYSTEWIYECFLLRVKSRTSYEHLLKKDILPLPTINTISKYIKKMKPIYGFDETIFDCLQLKIENFRDSERHGVLLINEIKISEAIVFDKETLKYMGFTDLGTHTQEKDVNRRGDHALVVMYQPFRGNWFQTVGAFLSRGCATGPVLHKITLEALLLIERTGLFVDGIVTDGASWNRNMWKCFGIEKGQTSCVHPCDNKRSLYFFSDFPHLIKCLRNFIVSCPETWTPDGVIKLSHWESIVDQKSQYVRKIPYRLTKNHIHPEFHQKLSVSMAFELFSKRTRAAIELLKPEREELADCNLTINFAQRVDNLIIAMMSRISLNSLLLIKNDTYKVISDFLDYIYEWEEHSLEKGYKFMSQGTCHGFKVTLKNTLNLLDYLSTFYNHEYLMMSRLNQDALKSFFGMNSCGSNDHSDSLTFVQVYRRLSLFSLVKPPRGSNIEEVDTFNSILEQKSPSVMEETQKTNWEQTIDSMSETSNSDSKEPHQYDVIEDHNYTIGKSM